MSAPIPLAKMTEYELDGYIASARRFRNVVALRAGIDERGERAAARRARGLARLLRDVAAGGLS